ncbi:MAG: hypothetical protein GWN58_27770 [Anaerolineae bacterium]|nr:hypothetical protein [Anaerolineae bacterium]
MSAIIQPVGEDVGYSHTKVCFADGAVITLPSLAGAPPAGLGLTDIHSTDLLYHMTFPYDLLVGRYAYAQKVGSPNISADWFKSQEYLALVLAGLDRNNSFHNSFRLVTGLPVDHLALRGELEQRLTGTHQVQWAHQQEPQYVAIEARVVSQGVGALALRLIDVDGNPTVPAAQLRNDERAIQSACADLGAGTSCLISTRGLHSVQSECRSLPIGAWTVERLARRELTTRYGEGLTRMLPRHELLYRLRSNTLTRYGEPVEGAAEIFETACRSVANEILHAMTSLWGEASHFDHLLMCGGGALLMGPYLQETYPALQVIDDNPVTANARGYLRLAKLLLK